MRFSTFPNLTSELYSKGPLLHLLTCFSPKSVTDVDSMVCTHTHRKTMFMILTAIAGSTGGCKEIASECPAWA